jgi:MFS family permease
MTSNLRSTLKRLHPNVWILSVTSFLTDISSEMILNLIPLFLFNVLGVRTSIVGLIEGLAETTASLVKIYSGNLSDRLKKRKRLAVIGYGLSSVAKPFLYFASSWSWVLGVRFFDRVGKGIRTAPRDALLAGSVAGERRGLAFGLHRAGDTAGAFTGLGIAALIVWFAQSNSELLSRKTFQIAVLASIIPAFLAVIILALGAKEVAMPQESESAPELNPLGLGRSFRTFLFVVVLFTLGNSSDAFIILRGQERGLSVLQIMLMLLTFNAIYAILSGPAGSLSDRIDRRYLLLAGWLVYGLIYLGFASAQSGIQIWIFFSLYGIYYAMTEGTARALVADLTSPDLRGTAYGWYHAAVGITAFPASLIAGLLWQGLGSWQGFGPSAPFYFGASMALLAGILFYLTVEAGSTQDSSDL